MYSQVLICGLFVRLLSASVSFEPAHDLDETEANRLDESSFVDIEYSKAFNHVEKQNVDPFIENSFAGSYDGDEILTDDQKHDLGLDNAVKRKFRKISVALWPRGIIPYKFNSASRRFRHGLSLRYTLLAMKHIEKWTCIDFINMDKETQQYNYHRPSIGHDNFLNIGTGSGCASYIGFTRGSSTGQNVYLSENIGCTRPGIIVHELGHALGFFHEQSRNDRDDSITVEWQNIARGRAHNFALTSTDNMAPYDYASTMHYSPKSFSRNGKWTIKANDPLLNFLLGQRAGLSFYDAMAINEAYQCAANCPSDMTCENGGFLLKSCDCLCPTMLTGPLCERIQSQQRNIDPLHQDDCDRMIDLTDSTPKFVSSPDYPGRYKNTRCVYLIKSPQGSKMDINLYIDLIPRNVTSHKCYHWLEIRYILVGQMGPKFCGKDSLHKIRSHGNIVVALLDGSNTNHIGKGFIMEINVVGANLVKQQTKPEAHLPVTTIISPTPMMTSTETATSPCKHGGSPINSGCACLNGFQGNTCEIIEFVKCDFGNQYSSSELCIFKQLQPPQDDQDWTLDHSGFIALQSTSQSFAILESAKIQIANGQKCLRITYRLEGNSQLELLFTDIRAKSKKVWQTKMETKGLWKILQFHINSQNDFQIAVAGTVSDQTEDHIAIKSFEISEAPCDMTNSVPVCMGSDTRGVPETPSAGLPFSCNFDTEPCGFKVINAGWHRTNSLQAGPYSDNKGNQQGQFVGEFVLYKVTPPSILVSPTLNTCVGACVSFWYYAYGFRYGAISMNINTGDNLTRKWTLDLNKFVRTQWTKVNVTVDVQSKFQVIFQHSTGPYWGSYAIDDVTITPRSCH